MTTPEGVPLTDESEALLFTHTLLTYEAVI